MLADPVIEGFVVNIRDVTDRRRREQRMSVLNRALGHDLRNNMNIVLGDTEFLVREHGPDDRAETIRPTATDTLELNSKLRDVERALDASKTPREPIDVMSVRRETPHSGLRPARRSPSKLTCRRTSGCLQTRMSGQLSTTSSKTPSDATTLILIIVVLYRRVEIDRVCKALTRLSIDVLLK
jgi:hypothetical protein